MPIADRTDGLYTTGAIKGPCRTLSTSNIVLAGLQTIAGVVLAAGDRCCVAGQDDATANGIYVVKETAWTRATDFNSNDDVMPGSTVVISGGDNEGWYQVDCDDNPAVIGTTEIDFVAANPGPAGTLTIGTVTAVTSAEPPTVTNSGTPSTAVLDFEIPGGAAATVTVGTVTTVTAGNPATVTNSGNSSTAILDFEIPAGPAGPGSGDLLSTNNLSDVDDAPTAFNNIKQSASTTVTGVVELATDAEALARADTARALTPSNMAVFGVERLQPSAMTTQQNNYNSGMSVSAMCQTVLEITPTNTIVLGGIDSTGVEFGKRVRLVNAGTSAGGHGAIIIAMGNTSSDEANRIGIIKDLWNKNVPVALVPQQHIDIWFNGSNWEIDSPKNGHGFGRFYQHTTDRLLNVYRLTGSTTGGGTTDDGAVMAAGWKMPMFRMDSGTTTTGRNYLSIGNGLANSNRATMLVGTHAGLFMTTVELVDISDGTDSFVVLLGLFTHTNGFYEDGAFWYYTHGSNWERCTADLGVGVTVNASSIVPTAGDLLTLGVFINGTGTRADFISSTDEGASFSIDSQTTNMPPSGAEIQPISIMRKYAGTTSKSTMLGDIGYTLATP